MSDAQNGQLQLVRLATVIAMTGLGKSSIYKLEAEGRFPSRVQLTKRATAWPLDRVEAWIVSRPRVLAHTQQDAA
jgi:prophage regulatory protein